MKIVNMQEYCVGFMCNPATKEVILIKKNRPAFQVGKWNGVGGKIEPGETPVVGMVREFWEETGIETLSSYWTHTLSLTGNYDNAKPDRKDPFVVHYFRHFVNDWTDWKYQQKTDEEVALINATSIYDYPTLDNLKWILPLQFVTNLVFPINMTWVH